MSILRDLDPKNARFSETALSEQSRKMFWIAPITLFLAAAIWLFFTRQFSQDIAMDDPTPRSTSPHPNNNSGSAESASPISIATADPLPTPNIGAAVIRASTLPSNDGKVDAKAQPDAFQALQQDLEKPRGKSTLAEPKQTKASEPEKHPRQRKAASATSSQTAAASSPASQRGSGVTAKIAKKPAERDIDIISAIVR